MLVLRAVLAGLMVAFGVTIVVRMASIAPSGGFGIVPGLVLGIAMVALGLHRISLIVRLRRPV